MSRIVTMLSDWKPLVVAVAAGTLISVLPHLVAKTRTGSFEWVADSDELGIYLAISSKLYHDGSF